MCAKPIVLLTTRLPAKGSKPLSLSVISRLRRPQHRLKSVLRTSQPSLLLLPRQSTQLLPSQLQLSQRLSLFSKRPLQRRHFLQLLSIQESLPRLLLYRRPPRRGTHSLTRLLGRRRRSTLRGLEQQRLPLVHPLRLARAVEVTLVGVGFKFAVSY